MKRAWLVAVVISTAAKEARAELPISLEDAIRIAKEHRSELTEAQIEVERASLGRLAARLAWLDLHVVSRGTAGYAADNIGSVPSLTARCATTPLNCTSAIYEAEIEGTLAVPIWTGLHNESKLAASRLKFESAEARVRAARTSVVVDVARAYWAVRRAELVRAELAKDLEQYEQIEALVGHQVSTGISPPFEHARVKAEMLAIASGVVAADRELARAKEELGAALQIDESIRLTDDPRAYKPAIPVRADAERAALEAHPELMALQADVEAAAYEVSAARGGYWPQVALVAQAFGGTGSLPPGVPNDHLLWGAFFGGAQLTWPIFDALQTWREVKDAELSEERAQAEIARLRRRVLAEVRTRHTELTLSLKELAPLEEAVALSRSTLDVVRRRYASGAARLLDVLDVEREHLRFEQDLIRHAVSVAELDMELRAVMGRL